MMRRKLQIEHLQKIAAIRELQRAGAEAVAVRASALVTEKVTSERSAAERRELAEESWHALHKEAVMPLELIELWTDKVQRETTASEHAADGVRAAKLAKERCSRNLQSALQRETLANDLQSEAAREYQRAREEIALQDNSDLYLQSKARP